MKYPTSWKDFELLDIGEGRKLERFGTLIVDRPEPAASRIAKSQPELWQHAAYRFEEQKAQSGSWNIPLPEIQISYTIKETTLRFLLRETAFKHLGIFPEQAVNWKFIAEQCLHIQQSGIQPKVLNLFAYTGAASLVASAFGAQVTHIDSSKNVVNWGRDNAYLNSIDNIRWIVEDARKFVQRSLRRGETYHGIIMDPPVFGMVPKGKNWKLNRDLPGLLESTMNLLDVDQHFFILNTYSPQLPKTELERLLQTIPSFPLTYESTILGLMSATGKALKLGNLVRFTSFAK